jgi:transcriptional regulator with XRE-family HTH domain
MTGAFMGNIQRVKLLANQKGVSFAHICRQLGTSPAYLAEILNRDGNVPVKRIQAIADVLETSVAYLNGETDDPNPHANENVSPKTQSTYSAEFMELYNALNESEQKLIVAQMKGILSNRE